MTQAIAPNYKLQRLRERAEALTRDRVISQSEFDRLFDRAKPVEDDLRAIEFYLNGVASSKAVEAYETAWQGQPNQPKTASLSQTRLAYENAWQR